MATLGFIKFIWIVFCVFVLGGSAILAFDWYASAVAEANARTRKRIERERANKVEDNVAELVEVYFGEVRV